MINTHLSDRQIELPDYLKCHLVAQGMTNASIIGEYSIIPGPTALTPPQLQASYTPPSPQPNNDDDDLASELDDRSTVSFLANESDDDIDDIVSLDSIQNDVETVPVTPFTATLPDGTKLPLVEKAVYGNGDCGFTALGVSREQLTEFLLTESDSSIARNYLLIEIKETFQISKLQPEDAPAPAEGRRRQQALLRTPESDRLLQAIDDQAILARDISNSLQTQHQLPAIADNSEAEKTNANYPHAARTKTRRCCFVTGNTLGCNHKGRK